ncbi:unnamed protein product [Rhizophagus irregularis]|nr:unnamed protein product [Rhizophagus irregularis]
MKFEGKTLANRNFFFFYSLCIKLLYSFIYDLGKESLSFRGASYEFVMDLLNGFEIKMKSHTVTIKDNPNL